jgi:hypothetical protein
MGRDQLLWPSSGEGENGRGKVYVQERGWRPSGEEERRLEGQEAKGVKRKTEQREVRIFCLPSIFCL